MRRAADLYRANAQIQGDAARHTKLWMRACWREGIVPLLQMHDALELSVTTREQGELVARLGRDAVQLEVPMRVDLKFGKSWGDAKHEWNEIAYGAVHEREAVKMSAAETIAKALGGHKTGNGWTARCPLHDDQTPSLSISSGKDGKVLVHCHAGCNQRDIFIAILRERGLCAKSGRYKRKDSVADDGDADGDADARKRSASALAIWRACGPVKATPVETYLAARGINLPLPESLRFHDHLKHPAGDLWPTMVALVTHGVNATPLAIHRTFLARDGSSKAPVDPQKMMLGPCRGGVVRLADADPNEVLMVGEGIETCLAAMQATGHRAWAALSTAGLRTLDLPEDVRDVIVLADGDEPGEAAARDCALRWKREGRRVRIARPPTGMDFNDLLVASSSSSAGTEMNDDATFGSDDEISDTIDGAEEVHDPLDGLAEKITSDPGAPFTPEVLEALAALKKDDRAAFETLRARLKSAGCRVTALDEAIAEESGDVVGRGPTQADILIDLAQAAELFHTADGTGFVDLDVNGHRETWPIRSRGFRRWLARRFFEATDGAPNSEALQSALNVIEARAHFDAPERICPYPCRWIGRPGLSRPVRRNVAGGGD